MSPLNNKSIQHFAEAAQVMVKDRKLDRKE